MKFNIQKAKIINSTEDNYVKFELEPLTRGMGSTIGNSMRRVLLSSLPGTKMYAISIDGVTHEYSVIDGIREDVTSIILNLKNLVLLVDSQDDSMFELTLDVSGPAVISARQITCPYGIKIVNEDLYITTLAANAKFKATIYVRTGRGYVSAEENKQYQLKVGTIYTDSNFLPVTKVNFEIGSSRVGHDSSFDKLTMEVWTNSAMKALTAVALAANVLSTHYSAFEEFDSLASQQNLKIEQHISAQHITNTLSIDDLGLTIRSYNCLKRAGFSSAQQLTQKSEEEVMKIRNLGKKSLKEIKEVLAAKGYGFKEV